MSAPLPNDELLLDLLAKRATEGLTSEEEAQLTTLLAAHPGVAAVFGPEGSSGSGESSPSTPQKRPAAKRRKRAA